MQVERQLEEELTALSPKSEIRVGWIWWADVPCFLNLRVSLQLDC